MSSFQQKPTKFLYFEVARLRTLYDKNPNLGDAIIKRYIDVVGELNKRGASWFWSPHKLDEFVQIVKAFIKPNKPAWRIFTPEEVFNITGFELPVVVDLKIDGMRLQIHREKEVQIFSEDEGFNKTSRFKEPLEDIRKLPEGTILDAEGVLVVGEEVLHRTSFIGYVNGKGFDPEKDEQTQFWVFDVLKWGEKDLTDEPLSVRLSYLKKIPKCEHLRPFHEDEEYFICETKPEVLAAIKKVAGQKGSEGAMIKVLSSKYVKDIHNKGWIKLKNLKEVDCLVVEIEQPKHHKGPLEGKPVEGVFNYHVAAGPYEEKDGKLLFDKVPTKVREYEGKVYAYLGKTFNTEIKVKVGDIIRVWSPEINRYEVKGTDLFTYGIYEPKVLEWVHERNIPDSLNVLNRLAQQTSELHPREVTKEESNSMYLPRHSCMLIWSGIKTLIVKEKHFEGMLKKDLFLCDDHYYYGKIVLTSMKGGTRKDIDQTLERSRITEEDMKDWEGAKAFYFYEFDFEALYEPAVVKVPHGAQTFFNLDEEENKEALAHDYSLALVGVMRKEDWCNSQGGSWITSEGKHICIGGEKTLDNGLKERILLGPNRKATMTYSEDKQGIANKFSSVYNSIESDSEAGKRLRTGLSEVRLTDENKTIGDTFRERGSVLPEQYKNLASEGCGGSYDYVHSRIVMYFGSSEGSLYHEMGHSIEPRAAPGQKDIWGDVWFKEKVSSYAKVSKSEGFAEAFREYQSDKESLREKHPETFKFIEGWLHG